MSKKTIIEIISGLLIILFLYTALSKLISVNSFRFVMGLSEPLKPYASFLKWAVPITEIIVVILMVIPKTKRLGLYAAAILMFVFTGYVAWMLTFTPKLPCNCGGVIGTMTWPQHLAFNIFFTLLAVVALWLSKTKKQFHQNSGARLNAV
jgi:hypothetical protein